MVATAAVSIEKSGPSAVLDKKLFPCLIIGRSLNKISFFQIL
jgi:hypothetical protein